MRLAPWHPPRALSPKEQTVVCEALRVKLIVLLRRTRHELIDDEVIKVTIMGWRRQPVLDCLLVERAAAYVGR